MLRSCTYMYIIYKCQTFQPLPPHPTSLSLPLARKKITQSLYTCSWLKLMVDEKIWKWLFNHKKCNLSQIFPNGVKSLSRTILACIASKVLHHWPLHLHQQNFILLVWLATHRSRSAVSVTREIKRFVVHACISRKCPLSPMFFCSPSPVFFARISEMLMYCRI